MRVARRVSRERALRGGWPAGVAALEDRRRARKAKMPKISAEYGVVSGRIAHEQLSTTRHSNAQAILSSAGRPRDRVLRGGCWARSRGLRCARPTRGVILSRVPAPRPSVLCCFHEQRHAPPPIGQAARGRRGFTALSTPTLAQEPDDKQRRNTICKTRPPLSLPFRRTLSLLWLCGSKTTRGPGPRRCQVPACSRLCAARSPRSHSCPGWATPTRHRVNMWCVYAKGIY